MLLHFDTATVLAFLTAVLIPGVSSLLAQGKVPANVAGLITPALAALSGFCAEWAQNVHGYHWQAGAVTAVITYGIAVASRYGLWKDTKTDAALLAFPRRQAVVTTKAAA